MPSSATVTATSDETSSKLPWGRHPTGGGLGGEGGGGEGGGLGGAAGGAEGATVIVSASCTTAIAEQAWTEDPLPSVPVIAICASSCLRADSDAVEGQWKMCWTITKVAVGSERSFPAHAAIWPLFR